jgi:hypothetical protein
MLSQCDFKTSPTLLLNTPTEYKHQIVILEATESPPSSNKMHMPLLATVTTLTLLITSAMATPLPRLPIGGGGCVCVTEPCPCAGGTEIKTRDMLPHLGVEEKREAMPPADPLKNCVDHWEACIEALGG